MEVNVMCDHQGSWNARSVRGRGKLTNSCAAAGQLVHKLGSSSRAHGAAEPRRACGGRRAKVGDIGRGGARGHAGIRGGGQLDGRYIPGGERGAPSQNTAAGHTQLRKAPKAAPERGQNDMSTQTNVRGAVRGVSSESLCLVRRTPEATQPTIASIHPAAPPKTQPRVSRQLTCGPHHHVSLDGAFLEQTMLKTHTMPSCPRGQQTLGPQQGKQSAPSSSDLKLFCVNRNNGVGDVGIRAGPAQPGAVSCTAECPPARRAPCTPTKQKAACTQGMENMFVSDREWPFAAHEAWDASDSAASARLEMFSNNSGRPECYASYKVCMPCPSCIQVGLHILPLVASVYLMAWTHDTLAPPLPCPHSSRTTRASP
jgi:hypothetical protein